MNKIPVILDVDLGVDDACAVLLALKRPNIQLLGITTTFGNRQLYRTNRNTLAFLEYVGRADIPVAKGAEKPLVAPMPVYEDEGLYVVHGAEGLGYAQIPEFTKANHPLPAEDFIAQTVKESDIPVTIIPVGPMTNIANFIIKYPELVCKVKQISFMGGGINKANISPYAEVNIYLDAEAAKIVFDSGIPLVMCPLDATHQGYITKAERETLKQHPNKKLCDLMFPALDFYGKFYEEVSKEPGCVLHDSLAVVAISDPEIVTFEEKFIDIIIEGEEYGRTKECEKGAKCKVATGTDREKFIELFFHSLA